jgi:hypothetical protein
VGTGIVAASLVLVGAASATALSFPATAASSPPGTISTVAGNGTAGYGGDGGPAAAAELSTPQGITVDKAGNLLITDLGNYRVRIVAESASDPGYFLGGCSATCRWAKGDIYTVAGRGRGAVAYLGDGGAATSAALSYTTDVSVDASGNLLIVDTNNNQVRVVAVSASNPGYTLSGCPSACTWAKGDIYTVAAELDHPWGVAVDASGNLLIGDQGGSQVRVVVVSASNPGYALGGCSGACTWARGDIYTVAGTGQGYSGDGGPATAAELYQATGVAVDTRGNVVIADEYNNRVRVVAVSASDPGYALAGCTATCRWAKGNIYTVAGNGTGGTCCDAQGDGRPAPLAELSGPWDVVLDASGNLIIADMYNNRVRVVAVSASNPGYTLSGCSGPCRWAKGDIYTLAGGGSTGYGGDGGPATSALLNEPQGVAVDNSGNLLISDTNNNRVRMVREAMRSTCRLRPGRSGDNSHACGAREPKPAETSPRPLSMVAGR